MIHSCMIAAEGIHFNNPHSKQHRNKAGWNEHVSKDLHHTLHWQILYLQHGHPQPGIISEMRSFTIPIYHKKVKQNNLIQKRIKKTRIAQAILENRLHYYIIDEENTLNSV